MQTLGTKFSVGIDSVRLMLGLDDFEGLLQPNQIFDSLILFTSKMSFASF